MFYFSLLPFITRSGYGFGQVMMLAAMLRYSHSSTDSIGCCCFFTATPIISLNSSLEVKQNMAASMGKVLLRGLFGPYRSFGSFFLSLSHRL